MSFWDDINEVLGKVGDVSEQVQDQINGWSETFGGGSTNDQAEPNPGTSPPVAASPAGHGGQNLTPLLLVGGVLFVLFVLAR
ncbi:MAG: hypothetical protein JW993_10230 [Sedimentisphaerales bacterium]|nr:hypothetical protein [Sedimentisphaerales bacterium]